MKGFINRMAFLILSLWLANLDFDIGVRCSLYLTGAPWCIFQLQAQRLKMRMSLEVMMRNLDMARKGDLGMAVLCDWVGIILGFVAALILA